MNIEEFVLGLGGRKKLTEAEAKKVLSEFGIPTTRLALVKERKEAESSDIPFPVVLKVCSSDILHKTDVGGVVLDIRDRNQLLEEFDRMKEKFPDEEFIIESFEKPGIEAIVGMNIDPTFGPTIMFGFGGIFTELFKDVSFRLIPINRHDAEEMIHEVKAGKLFEGFRGMKADKEQVIKLLLDVSNLVGQFGGRIDQMDLNPVFVREDGLVVVDAKIVLK